MWRFCGCDKETRSVSATAKMWWSEAWEPLGDLAERNPSRQRRRSVYNPVICRLLASRLELYPTLTKNATQ